MFTMKEDVEQMELEDFVKKYEKKYRAFLKKKSTKENEISK